MIKTEVIAVGKIKEKAFLEATGEYIKRLNAFCDLSITEIKPAYLPENPNEAQVISALKTEENAILSKIPKGFAVFPLCIEGKEISSDEFANTIEECSSRGQNICFIIGGSHGLSESVKKQGKGISFSKMTFPHRLFRVMLLEQIYRAFTIISGGKYHK